MRRRIIHSFLITLLVALFCYALSGFKSYSFYYELFFFAMLMIVLLFYPRRNASLNGKFLYLKRFNKFFVGLIILFIGFFLFEMYSLGKIDFLLVLNENPIFIILITFFMHLRERVTFKPKRIDIGFGSTYVSVNYDEVLDYSIYEDRFTVKIASDTFEVELLPADEETIRSTKEFLDRRLGRINVEV